MCARSSCIIPSLHFPIHLSHFSSSSVRLTWLTVVHRDILDLEDTVLSWWANTICRISIAPIVPDPWARRGRHIGPEGLLQNAVQEEHRLIGGPVDAVFVDDGDVVRWVAWRVCCFTAGFIGLIRILEPWR